MFEMKNILAVCVVILIGPSQAYADSADEDVWAECRATDSCTIEFNHLATQETDPFLFLGKVVDSEHPKWRTYRKSLRRYADVRDCLVAQEQTAETPNLLMIDWKRVGTGDHASVCVFRIAASLGNAERIVQWLEFYEFRHKGLNGYRGNGFQPHFEHEPVSQITARWTIDQYREVSSSWLASITGYEVVYGYQLVLQFDQNDKIAGVGVVTPTKLN